MAVDKDSFTTASSDTFSFLVRYRPTGVAASEDAGLPTEFALSQNYPNPFNPTTTINYQLPKATETRLEIFNLRGQRVATLVDRKEAAGYYSITWDGKDEYGNHVASGVYLYRLETEGFVKVRKLVLLR
jgi:hypothetical protein